MTISGRPINAHLKPYKHKHSESDRKTIFLVDLKCLLFIEIDNYLFVRFCQVCLSIKFV